MDTKLSTIELEDVIVVIKSEQIVDQEYIDTRTFDWSTIESAKTVGYWVDYCGNVECIEDLDEFIPLEFIDYVRIILRDIECEFMIVEPDFI